MAPRRTWQFRTELAKWNEGEHANSIRRAAFRGKFWDLMTRSAKLTKFRRMPEAKSACVVVRTRWFVPRHNCCFVPQLYSCRLVPRSYSCCFVRRQSSRQCECAAMPPLCLFRGNAASCMQPQMYLRGYAPANLSTRLCSRGDSRLLYLQFQIDRHRIGEDVEDRAMSIDCSA